MFKKLKELKDKLVGRVLLKKVAGKFAKHIATALAGIIAAKPVLGEAGIEIDFAQFETWLAVTLAGLAGALWNFTEHRLKK